MKKILKVASNVRWKGVKEEIVVIHVDSGNYYVLDPVSSFLWGEISRRPLTAIELVDAVLEEYDIVKERIVSDVENFCTYMLKESLIVLE